MPLNPRILLAGEIAVLLTLFTIAAYSLFTGARYLEILLPGGLPVGNVLAAVGICSLAAVSLCLSPAPGSSRILSRAAMAMALLWLPVSASIAGNVALVFDQSTPLMAWLAFTAGVVLLVTVSLAWTLVQALLVFFRFQGVSSD